MTQPYVNQDGQVELRGSPDLPVTLTSGGALAGGGAAVTGSGGQATFGLLCAGVGPASATLTVGSYVRSLDVPGCSPPPTTTTTTAPPPTTTAPGTPAPGQPPAAPAPAPAPTPSGTPGT